MLSSKVPNGLSLQRGSSGSSSETGSGFITKETFAAPLKTPGKTHRDGESWDPAAAGGW